HPDSPLPFSRRPLRRDCMTDKPVQSVGFNGATAGHRGRIRRFWRFCTKTTQNVQARGALLMRTPSLWDDASCAYDFFARAPAIGLLRSGRVRAIKVAAILRAWRNWQTHQ